MHNYASYNQNAKGGDGLFAKSALYDMNIDDDELDFNEQGKSSQQKYWYNNKNDSTYV